MAASDKLLFDRRCRLTIANPVPDGFSGIEQTDVIEIDGGTTEQRDVPGMRIQFKIEKTLKKQPNTSEIKVSNLSPSRRSSLQKKGVKVLLEAGYKETGTTRIFSGDVRTVDHVREKADWETVFKLGDGERAWRFARVSESFAPGTAATDVLRKLAKAMGLDMGNVDKELSSIKAKFDQGFAVIGSASKGFDSIIKSLRKTWSVQDGELQILDPYQALDLPIPEVSPTSGLIGSPEMGSPPTKGKPQLLKFKSLLIPIKPGAKVKLKSERYDGYVRIHSCSFEGDTSGGAWYTEMEGTIAK